MKGLRVVPRYIAGAAVFLRRARKQREIGDQRGDFLLSFFLCCDGECAWVNSIDCRIDYTHERPWSGMLTADEWRNGEPGWKFLHFPSLRRHIAKAPTYMHVFCWHYVKWWIISRHGRVTFSTRCCPRKDIRGRTTVNWGDGEDEIGFFLSFPFFFLRSIAMDKRFSWRAKSIFSLLLWYD